MNDRFIDIMLINEIDRIVKKLDIKLKYKIMLIRDLIEEWRKRDF